MIKGGGGGNFVKKFGKEGRKVRIALGGDPRRLKESG